LTARLRFFQAPYNCELVARKGEVAPSVAFDGLGREDSVLVTDGSGVQAAFRSGIGQLEADGTRVVDDGAGSTSELEGWPPPSPRVGLIRAADVKLQLDGRSSDVSPRPERERAARASRRRTPAADRSGHRMGRLRRLVAAVEPAERADLGRRCHSACTSGTRSRRP
jgi:hypothetical protein